MLLCYWLVTQMAVKVQNSMFLFIIVECNCVLLNHFLGDWDINSPSSSNVIYDEQPLLPSSHSASIFEEPNVPVIEDSLIRVQICEKAE